MDQAEVVENLIWVGAHIERRGGHQAGCSQFHRVCHVFGDTQCGGVNHAHKDWNFTVGSLDDGLDHCATVLAGQKRHLSRRTESE